MASWPGEVTWLPDSASCKLAPEHRLDLLARKRAEAKQSDVVAVDAEHRGLKSERARTAIEDHGRQIVQAPPPHGPQWSG